MASNMFANYDNINPNYTPTNREPINLCKPKIDPCRPKRPYEEYNDKGELIGYYWNYGDTVDLEFDIDGKITIEDNNNPQYIEAAEYIKDKKVVINIYDYRGDIIARQEFNNSSYLSVGTTIKSNSVINGVTYTQDTQIDTEITIINKSVLESGSIIAKNSMINGEMILEDKELSVKEFLNQGTIITFKIDDELSKKLIPGIYKITLTLIGEDEKIIITIFDESDCTLIVK